MKITSLETFPVPPRWLFLKLSTDEGPAGWGEPVVEGRAGTVAAAVEELSGYLVGTDPFRIEDHFQVLRRAGFYRDGPVLTSALSGIEQSLWDVKGRARLALGLMRGWEPGACARAGHVIAANALRGTGDWETLPHLDAVAAELERVPARH